MSMQTKRSHLTDEQFEFERRLLEEARDEIRSGLFMDEAEVKTWLASLDGEEVLPLPELRSSRTTTP